MTHYKVNAEICYSIFTKAESSVSSAQSTHSSIRSGVDQLGALCAKGEAAQITSALHGAYNRVLTQNMTTAEQRITKAVAGGRAAVAAIQRGDEAMANQVEFDVRDVVGIRATDGFER
ncbi:DUF6507 family protein [Arachnia propionica]|nr:hypothetical protein [Arachnia propionica]